MEKEHSENQLADVITDEPITFMGCTTSEIMMLMVINISVSFFLGVLVFIGCLAISVSLSIILGAGMLFGGSFALTFFSMERLQTIKEQHGDNFYKERLQLMLCELGLSSCSIFNDSVRFSRGRSV